MQQQTQLPDARPRVPPRTLLPATSSSASAFRSPAWPTRTAPSASAHDPKTSALDANCKAHEVDNLYVVDGSFFPSSAAVNPALTIMANALRVGDHLIDGALGVTQSMRRATGRGSGLVADGRCGKGPACSRANSTLETCGLSR